MIKFPEIKSLTNHFTRQALVTSPLPVVISELKMQGRLETTVRTTVGDIELDNYSKQMTIDISFSF